MKFSREIPYVIKMVKLDKKRRQIWKIESKILLNIIERIVQGVLSTDRCAIEATD